ncbi:MAG TPA: heavy metal translocating P-type ATPase [Methylomusa anaerophila]|uniref:P-type Ca(2+) transporter n=1 Tax=Methylomusa anaerophila TaxID=1930071 RepID=A0A348ANJ7_9FIRM|nr:heavy metal translocating P-type ATPase [Methylomusa anaerophila]BBB92645.1 calcium-transporting ATPase [Methylomusa anaerophila]HML87502.1 heavy metal translocating P-type ATPase [Methylomusa anaerophila]
MQSCLSVVEPVCLLPGRIRVSVSGLYRNPVFAKELTRQLSQTAGVKIVSASPLTGRTLVVFDESAISFPAIKREMEKIGRFFIPIPPLAPKQQCGHTTQAAAMPTADRVKNIAKGILSVPVIYAAATGGVLAALIGKRALLGVSPLARSQKIFNLAALTTIVAGYPVLKDGLSHLAKKKQINSDLIIFLATLILLAMRESLTGLSVLWIVHLSNLFQYVMQARSRASIEAILAGKQQSARVFVNGKSRLISAQNVKAGDVVVVHSGERISVDGRVSGGKATVTQAAVTGEYYPVAKRVGDDVFAGAMVEAGSIKIQTEKAGQDTAIYDVIRMVQRSGSLRASGLSGEVYSAKIVPWTIAIAVGIFLLTRDFNRSLAILLAGCPATVVLARQSALGTAVARAARHGIFVKDARHLETAGLADTVLFDKTGTLTSAKPQVAELVPCTKTMSAEDLLIMAASAEKATSHPLARMLVEEAKTRNLSLRPADENHLVVGRGVRATIDGKEILVGNEQFMVEEKIDMRQIKARAARMRHLGNSVLYVAVARKLAGIISISDTIRAESREAVENLRVVGIEQIGLLTGDTIHSAETVAKQLGLSEHWSGMLPEDKVNLVKDMKANGHRIMMVGDGVNDSPAMAAADTGVALGAGGTDWAIKSAGIVLSSDDPRKIAETIQISNHTMEIMRQNMSLAVGLNVIGIALAVSRFISPVTAAILQNISTVAVICNSARLLSGSTKSSLAEAKVFPIKSHYSSSKISKINNVNNSNNSNNVNNVNIVTEDAKNKSRRFESSPSGAMTTKQIDLQRFANDKPEMAVSKHKNNLVYFRSKCDAANYFPLVTNQAQVHDDHWHSMPLESVCERFETLPRIGLTGNESSRRRQIYGTNLLAEGEKESFWQLFKNQFKDFMVQVLLGAVGISFFLGKGKDALLTLAILMANAWLGAAQEKQAEKSMDALQKMTAPQARVIRDGCITKINAQDLVPGDILVLEAGDRIPADARLLTTIHFEAEEASLTGETVSAKKNYRFTGPAALTLGDRKNMVYMGTSVSRGRGTAVVVATGMNTEMGKIASLIQQHSNEATPLQRRLEELGRYLVYGCLAVSGIVFIAGLMRGLPLIQMLQTAASLAVAAIPEGLTAIVVIALAMGVKRMTKRNIIVRQLSSIETLGCASVICSDKTGTLTKNEMTVRSIYSGGRQWRISGEGYEPQGEFIQNGQTVDTNSITADESLARTLVAGALCNNAKLCQQVKHSRIVSLDDRRAGGWSMAGDPTEGALVVAAAKAGIWCHDLEKMYKREKEIPFEPERRMMSVVCSKMEKSAELEKESKILYTKGAPDTVLSACTHYLLPDGDIIPLGDEERERILRANEQMTGEALRVLATAFRPFSSDAEDNVENLEQGLVFCGLVGMIDPPRPEVLPAIAKCHRAGIKVVMITGDHPNTAKAIAKELGIFDSDNRIVLGREIDQMSDAELAAVTGNATVFARTSPHHKLKIVKAFKDKGFVVAMTGDGVNDAPAVKAADIGIAMGITGTDVTKEAASMTLADDNFATIVKAIEEGRSIYANIRKSIRYLVATNVGEVVMMLLAVLLGLPLPLLPLQLLWINLVGDGLPAVALVNDPPSKDIMNHPPRSADDSVLAGGLGRKVLTRGVLIGVASLGLYAWKLMSSGNVTVARTMVLAQLAISQFMHIFDCRMEKQAGKVGLLSNLPLVAAVALSMAMVIGAIHIPGLQPIFTTVPLYWTEWLLALGVAAFTSLLDIAAVRITEKAIPDSSKPIVPCVPAPMPSV